MAPSGHNRAMVTEIARLTVVTGQEAELERAFGEFKATLAKAPGFHGAELHRGVEKPSEYWLFVSWESVEAHTVDFKASGGFARWDELVGPHLALAPDAVHAELRATVEPAN